MMFCYRKGSDAKEKEEVGGGQGGRPAVHLHQGLRKEKGGRSDFR